MSQTMAPAERSGPNKGNAAADTPAQRLSAALSQAWRRFHQLGKRSSDRTEIDGAWSYLNGLGLVRFSVALAETLRELGRPSDADFVLKLYSPVHKDLEASTRPESGIERHADTSAKSASIVEILEAVSTSSVADVRAELNRVVDGWVAANVEMGAAALDYLAGGLRRLERFACRFVLTQYDDSTRRQAADSLRRTAALQRVASFTPEEENDAITIVYHGQFAESLVSALRESPLIATRIERLRAAYDAAQKAYEACNENWVATVTLLIEALNDAPVDTLRKRPDADRSKPALIEAGEVLWRRHGSLCVDADQKSLNEKLRRALIEATDRMRPLHGSPADATLLLDWARYLDYRVDLSFNVWSEESEYLDNAVLAMDAGENACFGPSAATPDYEQRALRARRYSEIVLRYAGFAEPHGHEVDRDRLSSARTALRAARPASSAQNLWWIQVHAQMARLSRWLGEDQQAIEESAEVLRVKDPSKQISDDVLRSRLLNVDLTLKGIIALGGGGGGGGRGRAGAARDADRRSTLDKALAVLDHCGDDPRATLLRARIEIEQGDRRSACETALRAAEAAGEWQRPGSGTILRRSLELLADLYRGATEVDVPAELTGRLREAVRKAKLPSAVNSGFLCVLGAYFERIGEAAEARRLWDEITQAANGSRNWAALERTVNLAKLNQALDQWEKLIEDGQSSKVIAEARKQIEIGRALGIDDDQRLVHVLARAQARVGKVDDAIGWFEQSANSDRGAKNTAMSRLAIGHVYRAQGRAAEAAAQYRLAYAADPSRPMGLLFAAQQYSLLPDRWLETIECLEGAHAHPGDRRPAYTELLCAEIAGRWQIGGRPLDTRAAPLLDVTRWGAGLIVRIRSAEDPSLGRRALALALDWVMRDPRLDYFRQLVTTLEPHLIRIAAGELCRRFSADADAQKRLLEPLCHGVTLRLADQGVLRAPLLKALARCLARAYYSDASAFNRIGETIVKELLGHKTSSAHRDLFELMVGERDALRCEIALRFAEVARTVFAPVFNDDPEAARAQLKDKAFDAEVRGILLSAVPLQVQPETYQRRDSVLLKDVVEGFLTRRETIVRGAIDAYGTATLIDWINARAWLGRVIDNSMRTAKLACAWMQVKLTLERGKLGLELSFPGKESDEASRLCDQILKEQGNVLAQDPLKCKGQGASCSQDCGSGAIRIDLSFPEPIPPPYAAAALQPFAWTLQAESLAFYLRGGTANPDFYREAERQFFDGQSHLPQLPGDWVDALTWLFDLHFATAMAWFSTCQTGSGTLFEMHGAIHRLWHEIRQWVSTDTESWTKDLGNLRVAVLELQTVIEKLTAVGAGAARARPLDIEAQLQQAIRRAGTKPGLLIEEGLYVSAHPLALREALAEALNNTLAHGGKLQITAGHVVPDRHDPDADPAAAMPRPQIRIEFLNERDNKKTNRGTGLGIPFLKHLVGTTMSGHVADQTSDGQYRLILLLPAAIGAGSARIAAPVAGGFVE